MLQPSIYGCELDNFPIFCREQAFVGQGARQPLEMKARIWPKVSCCVYEITKQWRQFTKAKFD